DLQEMKQFNIPEIDLVIVDLYPFEETLKEVSSNGGDEKLIIEKIDIGGPSMIRGAAKNFKDVTVIAAKNDYSVLEKLLSEQNGSVSLEQRRSFAAKAFEVVGRYDIAIYNYFNSQHKWNILEEGPVQHLRYGENPHQHAEFFGDFSNI